MNISFKEEFQEKWKSYFNNAELPIALFYTGEEKVKQAPAATRAHRCLMADLAAVRKGQDLRFGINNIGCNGGKRYLGFTTEMSADFPYFLSCGIPGKVKGERYKQSPELVEQYMAGSQDMTAPAKYAVFKRWDNLDAADDPQVIIFFAEPDVLSGLFALANYDRAEPNGVFCPFSAGCGSIVRHPFLEANNPQPRAVLGMFDVTARPLVPASTLTFSVPANRFFTMMKNMDESFLITNSWKAVRERIQ